MSMKEKEQIQVFEQLKRREMTQKTGAEMLDLSERQVRNKLRAYEVTGVKSLIHKNRGRKSPQKWDVEEQKMVYKLLQNEWEGFGPTFVSEKLEENHAIKKSSETIRHYMNAWGMRRARPRRADKRKMRERKRVFGTMIQVDGSPHRWFEDGRYYTLLVFIDDATSKVVHMELVDSESVEDVMRATRKYVERFGRPRSFYVDRGSVFRVNTNNPDHDKLSQWERAMAALGIKVIHAMSPQGKGRVERSHRTHQDRLIKEMRLRGIRTVEQANLYLPEYMEKHNSKFSYEPTEAGDAHRSVKDLDLDAIFCLHEKRKIQKDYTIRYKTKIYQLLDKRSIVYKPGDSVVVRESFNGSLAISIRGYSLEFEKVVSRPKKPVKVKTCSNKIQKPGPASKRWNSGVYRKKPFIHQPRIY